jgi:hypothetical protein
MDKNKSFFLVKVLVFAMGITLIAGVIALIYLVYQRSAPIANTQSFQALPAFQSARPEDCRGGDLKIDEKALVDDVIIKDNHMVLLLNGTEEGAGQKILVIDYCANKVISHIDLTK